MVLLQNSPNFVQFLNCSLLIVIILNLFVVETSFPLLFDVNKSASAVGTVILHISDIGNY